MKSHCPAPELLVELALAGDPPSAGGLEPHLRVCESCRKDLRRLRETATAVRLMPVALSTPVTACLDDDDIAGLIDGAAGQDSGDKVVHLASCARCRSRLAVVDRVLQSDAVDGEVRKLAASAVAAGHKRRRFALPAFAAAAAAIVAVAVLPRAKTTTTTSPSATEDPLHRESAITITIAPRILGPAGPASAQDSLLWTSVPHADRYQVKVFDGEGTLVVDQHTSDTTFAIPSQLARAAATTYFWKVEARTGWDRWVVSEWKEFTMGPPREKR